MIDGGSARWPRIFALLAVIPALQNCTPARSAKPAGTVSASAPASPAAGPAAGSAPSPAPAPAPAPTPTPPPAPQPYALSPNFSLVTSSHRYAATAYGGWGPHLGHLLRSAKNEIWFVDDTGNDVNRNLGAAYYKLNNGVWTQAGFQYFPGRVQQNVGSIMLGNLILSYGIDVDNNRVVECYYSTETVSYACNYLPFDTGAGQNYIGATVSPSGTRVVWWTGGGNFSYIYNYGGGWNGPVVTSANGYAGFAYVYGRIGADNASLELVGAAPKAAGGASVGYGGVHGHTLLGNQMNWLLLEVTGMGLESWLDANGGAHIITYGQAEPQVFYKAKGGALAFSTTVGVTGVIGARFVQSAANLHLVMSLADGRVVYKYLPLIDAKGPINWAALKANDLAVPAGLGALSLYPESPMYQTNQPADFHLGVNGYANQGLVYHIYSQ